MDATTSGAALEKNRAIYDHSDDALWQRLVYQPVHAGWHFANIGGRTVLDRIGEQARLGPDSAVVDLCCGSGATACYLAQTFGCTVLGLDLNGGQIARARERAASDARLQFEEADVAAWQPSRRYDLVFTLDSLTLIPDLPRLFANCRSALRAGGSLAVAEVVAGPRLSNEMRAFALAEDGAVNLVTADELGRIIADAGFGQIEITSLDDQAIDAFTRIQRSAHDSAPWDEALMPRVEEWRLLSDKYLAAFTSNELGYSQITAVAP